MGRTSAVVRTGPSVRAGHRAAMVTAVTATAAVLLAGCGTRTADLSARGRPTPAVTVGARPGTGRLPAVGSRAEARALASRLLSRLVLPPGARRVRLPVLPALLRQPLIAYGGTHAADVHSLFLLSGPMTAVQGFLMARRPTGMQRYSYGPLAEHGHITMETVSFEPRSLPAGVYSAELAAAVVPAAGGGSLLRADAEVIWYPARSAAEHVDPARYREAVVSIGVLNPRPHTVTRTITSAGVVARLATLVNGLRAAPFQPPSCPAIVASYRIRFVPAAPSAARVVVTPSGCITVGVTVAGTAQPPLWGDAGLIRAATRLLHVKSVL